MKWLQAGKVTFSYIYGIGVLGCLAFYCLLSLMATSIVTLSNVISVLGYCLLPMVVLSGINVLITIQWVDKIWKKLNGKIKTDFIHYFSSSLTYQYESTTRYHSGIVGLVLTGFSILWCALSASKLFVTSLAMDRQQILVAYPAALFYGVFALITIFWDEKCLIQFVRWECKTTNKIEKLYLMWKFFFYAFHLVFFLCYFFSSCGCWTEINWSIIKQIKEKNSRHFV